MRRKKIAKIHTIWGFPVEAEEAFAQRAEAGRNKRPNGPKERGVAMVTALLVVSFMFMSVADMLVTSSVSLEMAIGVRDRIKAEYLAKSGKNLALFLISGDLGFDLYQFDKLKKVPSDGPGDFWTYVNGLPIGPESMKMMQEAGGIKLSQVNDSKVFQTLDSFDGSFTVTVEDEAAKLNINHCPTNYGQQCRELLTALMSCPAELEYLEKKKAKPEELVANLTDWIDENNRVTPGSNFGSEGDPYGDREPRMRVKNAPLDSLEEIKVVEGWDDDIYNIFSPYLTVYPPRERKEDEAPININSSMAGMMTCLMKDKGEECRKNAILKMNPAKSVDQLENISDFNGLKSRLANVFCETGKNATKNFTYRSDVFRIKVAAESGTQMRNLELVVTRAPPSGEDTKNNFGGSYKILYWKIL